MTTKLSEKLSHLRHGIFPNAERVNALIDEAIAQAEAQEAQAGDGERYPTMKEYTERMADKFAHELAASQAIGEQTPVAWMYPSGETKHPIHLTLEKDIAEEECRDKAAITPLYRSPMSPEARDKAIDALAKDAVDLIKVLANQIHGLPQASITALSHRAFNEMFDTANGAAYGQAKSIVDRYQALSALRAQ